MSLPNDLKDALQSLFATIPRTVLLKAFEELSDRYRSPERDKLATFINSNEQRLAYLAVRLPATYAVVHRVLSECQRRCADFTPKSLCDIGAGPGTASWAAQDVFPSILKATLSEKDEKWFEIGKSLMNQTERQTLLSALWQHSDIQQTLDFGKHDLVVLSYVIGELSLVNVICHRKSLAGQ